jgi:hypothetical protein
MKTSDSSLIVGKHRAKISALQTPSQETLDYAKSLNMHVLGRSRETKFGYYSPVSFRACARTTAQV